MHMIGRICIFLLLFLWAPLLSAAWATTDDSQDGILVGRISHVEGGKLLRYVPENNDWVATVQDAPFGLEDALYAENDARAECILPNSTWIRIGGNTQMQMIALDPETTIVDVASGLTRMYNKSPDAIIKATTPFGYVAAPEGAIFDLYVGDESMEVIAVRGSVDFIHEATGSRYEVRERDGSLIADSRNVARGNGTVDAAWDDWNGQRDMLWGRRLSNQGQGAGYLPEPIRGEAYALEENGRWEQVHYEGNYHTMWRPTSVEPGWRPFTEGRWTVYYDDNCWIPAEPFGYVTHHYGSWIWIDSFRRWYWMPPVARVTAASPRWHISFGWYPGRVGWMHSGSAIGWVPLAPYEDYYTHRPWGRRVVVIGQNRMPNIDISRYRYLDRAVIISSDHLYRGNRYTPFVQRFNRGTILNSYQPAAVINKTVIRAYDTDTRRFAFNDAKVERKPHATVLNRISTNRQIAQNTGNTGGQQIRQNLGMTTAAALPTAATVNAPVVSNKMVAANKVHQPIETVSFPKKEMQPKERQRPLNASPEQINSQRGPARPAASRQDDLRRMQSATNAREQVMQRNTTAPLFSPSNRGPVGQENERQIKSPREMSPQAQAGPSFPQQAARPENKPTAKKPAATTAGNATPPAAVRRPETATAGSAAPSTVRKPVAATAGNTTPAAAARRPETATERSATPSAVRKPAATTAGNATPAAAARRPETTTAGSATPSSAGKKQEEQQQEIKGKRPGRH